MKAALDKACAQGGSSAFFTGIDPGFVSDCLAITMSSVLGDITQIRTWEMIDYGTYPVAETIAAIGFGCRPEDLPLTGAASLVASWGCAPHLMADALGLELDDLALAMEVWLSPTTYTELTVERPEARIFVPLGEPTTSAALSAYDDFAEVRTADGAVGFGAIEQGILRRLG